MTIEARSTIKTYFADGDVPTEEQFIDSWDSVFFKDEVATSDITFDNVTVNSIQYVTTAAVTVTTGQTAWNDTSKTLDIGLEGGVTMQVGQELLIWVKNESGSTVDDGDMVYVSGSTGVHLVIGLADASDLSKSTQIGMITTPGGIANNGFGYANRFGGVRGLDTTGTGVGEVWSNGTTLYLSATTPGALSDSAPGSANYTVGVGLVVNAHATQGIIGIDPKQPHASDPDLGTSDLVGPTQKAVKSYASFKGAMVYLSSDQSITSGGATVDWAAESYDTDNIFTTVGVPERLSVPTGKTKVRVSVGLQFAANSTGYRGVNILKNGAAIYNGYTSVNANANTSTVTSVMASTPALTVTNGDYFTAQAIQVSGGALNLDGGTGAATWFAMEILPE